MRGWRGLATVVAVVLRLYRQTKGHTFTDVTALPWIAVVSRVVGQAGGCLKKAQDLAQIDTGVDSKGSVHTGTTT